MGDPKGFSRFTDDTHDSESSSLVNTGFAFYPSGILESVMKLLAPWESVEEHDLLEGGGG